MTQENQHKSQVSYCFFFLFSHNAVVVVITISMHFGEKKKTTRKSIVIIFQQQQKQKLNDENCDALVFSSLERVCLSFRHIECTLV